MVVVVLLLFGEDVEEMEMVGEEREGHRLTGRGGAPSENHLEGG